MDVLHWCLQSLVGSLGDEVLGLVHIPRRAENGIDVGGKD